MTNTKEQIATPVTENQKVISVSSIEPVSDHIKNDKRYETPFEDENAPDDDFID